MKHSIQAYPSPQLVKLFPTEKQLKTTTYHKDKYNYVRKGEYLCFCGNTFISRTNHINNGSIISCGCYLNKIRYISTRSHGLSKTRLYRIWCKVKERCYNKKCKQYQYYGKRNIRVCNKWKQDFTEFKKWADVNGYDDKLSIDRINNNGNYEPNNCRWVNQKIQSSNRRDCKNILNVPGVRISGEKFQVRISVNNKSNTLGSFNTIKEASDAYQKAKKEKLDLYLKNLKKQNQ